MSIPVDPELTASVYQKAAQAGVKLVFMDNTPNGLQHGKDYVSIVSADNYGNGIESANIMAEKLDKKGKCWLYTMTLIFLQPNKERKHLKKL